MLPPPPPPPPPTTTPPPAMDSTPPSRQSRLRTKLAARFAPDPPPLELTPPLKRPHLHLPSSPLRLADPSPGQSPRQLRELLLMSPSPIRRSKHRGLEKTEPLEELVELAVGSGLKRRCKSKGVVATAVIASPRATRRVRRRAEEERDVCAGDDGLKVRRRKHSRTRKEKLGFAPAVASPKVLPQERKDYSGLDEESFVDGIKQIFTELVMWKNAAKSSLWFGCGSLFFLSSSLTKGVNFSIVSAVSQLALLILAISFMYKTISKRGRDQRQMKDFKLTEDDIVRFAKYILPVANASIGITRKLFSGEPAMTLKMAPALLFASEYGHWITLWRLFFIAFFASFTIPKLYSSYSKQIDARVEGLKCRVLETWAASSHKKMVAASALTAFWNLSEVKTRIFAAFLLVVIYRHYWQRVKTEILEDNSEEQAVKLIRKADEQFETMDVDDKSGDSEKHVIVLE